MVSIDGWNRRAFDSEANARENPNDAGLFPAEARILETLPPETRFGDVLELGVGSGRLVRALAPGARSYLGTDYAAAPLEVARRAFPGCAFGRLDAREAARLGRRRFDLVLFGYNGIDYVDDAGRRDILASVREVLRPGGAFVFSFHNLDWAGLEASLALPSEEGQGVDLGRRREAAENRALLAQGIRDGGDYRIVNDAGMNHGLLTYYTTLAAQLVALASAGFKAIQAFDLAGRPLDPARPFTADYMIHALARA